MVWIFLVNNYKCHACIFPLWWTRRVFSCVFLTLISSLRSWGLWILIPLKSVPSRLQIRSYGAAVLDSLSQWNLNKGWFSSNIVFISAKLLLIIVFLICILILFLLIELCHQSTFHFVESIKFYSIQVFSILFEQITHFFLFYSITYMSRSLYFDIRCCKGILRYTVV